MTKKILFLFAITAILIIDTSCDNGDVDLPSFQFDDTVYVCGDYVLYRQNSSGTEAIILLVPAEYFNPEATTQLPLTPDNCIYRIFDTAFDQNYFCSDIPPASPVVITEWNASPASENYISIIPESSGTDAPSYQITLHHLVLENGENQMIFDSFDFGIVQLPG